MNKLQWCTVQKQINDLLPQEVNPRRISEKQMADLTRSMKKFNLVEIPAVDLDGKILAGHQRIKVLQLLGRGEEIIDVRQPNRKLTEDEAKQYLIASNALGGDWDFDQIDLTKFWDEDSDVKDDFFNIEQELKKIVVPETKLGDIITLGKHKIICGDSTNQEVLKQLLGDEKVSMIYSDPVYNISINYNGGIGGKKDYGGDVNDTRSYDEYKTFITDSLQCSLAVSFPDTHVFYWCDQIYIGLIQEIYRFVGIDNKRVCLWLKNNQNPVPSVAFNKVYEPVVYGIRGKPYLTESVTNLNEVMNKGMGTGNELFEQVNAFIDIWVAKRLPSKSYEHATSKPVTLHEKAIKRCTKPNDIILDSFLGSGSTLLAGEQLDRRVYGCELEPRFCDLIIKRYKALTGKEVTVKHHEEK